VGVWENHVDLSRIAAQLYTVRDFTRTPAELARTLRRVREVGYSAVQVSAVGPIDPDDLGRLLDAEGLACCATHVPLDRLRSDPVGVVADHQRWKCGYVAVGGFFPEAPATADWDRFADDFNAIAAAYAGSGLRLGYHNHSHELAAFDGRTALARLVDRLDPSIFLEIDTYWIAHGGGDPAAWIAGLPGRVPCVHLKDMGMAYPREQQMREVGEGNLNWPAILSACRSAGTEWHIVEQDTCYRDPFDSLAISLRNLRAWHAKVQHRDTEARR
jgi:sugar phosphate isomerase/epimerase